MVACVFCSGINYSISGQQLACCTWCSARVITNTLAYSTLFIYAVGWKKSLHRISSYWLSHKTLHMHVLDRVVMGLYDVRVYSIADRWHIALLWLRINVKDTYFQLLRSTGWPPADPECRNVQRHRKTHRQTTVSCMIKLSPVVGLAYDLLKTKSWVVFKKLWKSRTHALMHNRKTEPVRSCIFDVYNNKNNVNGIRHMS